MSEGTSWPEVWARRKDAHCLWIVSPEGYPHSAAFHEVALSLQESFAEMGGSLPIVSSRADAKGRRPILLGGNLLGLLPDPSLPAGAIIYNLEQLFEGNPWLSQNPVYVAAMRTHPVFDYSDRNIETLRALGIGHAHRLGVGFSPCLRRIGTSSEPDIDVLFYGSLNARRNAVIEALRDRGLRAAAIFGVYGEERDRIVARSKIVLNVHQHRHAFEIVRVSYLLANEVCVVSEGTPDDPEIAPLAEGLALAPYDALAQTCIDLIHDPDRRTAIARKGFELFSARKQSDFLRSALLSLSRHGHASRARRRLGVVGRFLGLSRG